MISKARLNSKSDTSSRLAFTPVHQEWIEAVAGSTGLSIDILQQLLTLADNGDLSGTAIEVVDVLLTWIESKPILLMDVVRRESLEGLFGQDYQRLASDNLRAVRALNAIKGL